MSSSSSAPTRHPTRYRPRARSEAGATGEIPEQRPGQTASHTFNLTAGKYVFICNVPGHDKSGMYGSLTVR